MHPKLLTGVFTALVTPINKGKLCLEDLKILVEKQVSAGVHGLIPLGSTGESTTLTEAEQRTVIQATVEAAAGRVPVFAGAGSASTAQATSLARQALEAGADGLLVVTPYYNRPSQEGLYRHYSTIAETSEKPLLLYANPPRCAGVQLEIDTIVRLRAAHPNIIGIKDASGCVTRIAELVNHLGEDFSVFVGDEAISLPAYAVGARGSVSAFACLAPEAIVRIWEFARTENTNDARELFLKYLPLFQVLCIESNPTPLKHALHYLGLTKSPEARLPLAPLTEKNALALEHLLKTFSPTS